MSEFPNPPSASRQSYSDKLKNPQWQRMRLEIMERDGWCCQECGDSERTLNVHHRYYRKGNAPWDYPQWALITLCESCHESNTDEADAARLIEHACFYGISLRSLDDLLIELMYRGVSMDALLDFVKAFPIEDLTAERTLRVIQRAFLDEDSPQRERIVTMTKAAE